MTKMNQEMSDFDLTAIAIFTTIASISMFSTTIAVLVIRRSKKIHYSAKLLTIGLLAFDFVYILLTACRRFSTNEKAGVNLVAVQSLFLQLATCTIGMMSIERYFVFVRPMVYLNYFSSKAFVRRLVLCTWLLQTCVYLGVRYGACYLKYGIAGIVEFRKCSDIIRIYSSTVVALNFLVSFVCYGKIFILIRKKVSARKAQEKSSFVVVRHIRSLKSTSIVLIHLLVLVACTIAYAIVLIVSFRQLGGGNLRLYSEIITLCKCFLDPVLHVLWFKECRMEVLKLVSICTHRFDDKIENMRIQVYNIVTKENNDR